MSIILDQVQKMLILRLRSFQFRGLQSVKGLLGMAGIRLLEKKGGTLRLFNLSGRRLSENEWEISDVEKADDTPVVMKPSPASPLIEQVIEGDYQLKKGTKIRSIRISPRMGLRLHLEGVLTDDIINRAALRDDVIVFSQVPISRGGKTRYYKIVVKKLTERQAAIVTLDRTGSVIEGKIFKGALNGSAQ